MQSSSKNIHFELLSTFYKFEQPADLVEEKISMIWENMVCLLCGMWLSRLIYPLWLGIRSGETRRGALRLLYAEN